MSDVNRGRSISPDAATPLLTSERLQGGVRAVAGIFVGVCVVFIAAILTLSAARADRALLDAIELFAGAIPLLVTAFLLSFSYRARILGLIFFAGGALATISGIAQALAHVDMSASAIFLISLVACVFVVFVVDTLTRFTYTKADHPQAPQPGTWFDETDPYHPMEVPQTSDAEVTGTSSSADAFSTTVRRDPEPR